jgi:hypothetical protein
MLNECRALITPSILGDDGIMHDFCKLSAPTFHVQLVRQSLTKRYPIDEVIRNFALLLMFRVAYCKRRSQIIPLLFKLQFPFLLLFLAFYPADFTLLDARFDVVGVALEVGFEHSFEIGEKVATPPYSFALTDVPFGFLALEYKGGYGSGIGGLLRGCGA